MGAVWDFIISLSTNFGAGICLLVCGAVWVLDTIFEASRREGILKRDNNWDFDMTTLLKILSLIACVSGIVFATVGILGYVYHSITKTLTYTSLIIFGFLTLLKPVNDLPIASVIALLITSALTAIVVSIVSFFELSLSIQTGVVIVIILVIVFIVSLAIAKFWLAGPKLVSKIVSWPVISIIGAGYCFILGGLVLAGVYT
jgi:hypothetical protein